MAAQNGTVTSMSVFVASPISASPNNQFQVAIYADNNGTPGALIASSVSQTLVPDAWKYRPDQHSGYGQTPTTGWPTTPTALPETLTTSDWIVEGPPPHGSTRNLSALGLQPTDRWEAQAATEYLCIAPFSEKGRSDAL